MCFSLGSYINGGKKDRERQEVIKKVKSEFSDMKKR